MEKTNIKASLIRKGVIHIEYETQYHLTAAFMRLQEYYESPYDEFKDKFFRHEDFFDKYTEGSPNKEFSYFTDWCGFNIPGDTARSFYNKFKDKDMWDKEIQLFESIFNLIGDSSWFNDKNFYIIGSHKGTDQKSTIKHELAHAYWYLYPEYQKKMYQLLRNNKYITEKQYINMCNSLKKLGYHIEKYDDEIQSFLSTGNKTEILSKLQPGMEFKKPSCFKRWYDTFDRELI